ncbi:sensor histidine kinase [Vibrio ordalii]|uniref:sensor histidine kinase n=1 Tax=Vibrio ordalii TaxID=28174 RepID=UPI0002482CE5|nr:ATP-binding protein [Vibrio ordalii]
MQHLDENKPFLDQKNGVESSFHHIMLSLLEVLFSTQSQDDKLDEMIELIQQLFPNTHVALFFYYSERKLRVLRASMPLSDDVLQNLYPVISDDEFCYFSKFSNHQGEAFSLYQQDFPEWESGVTFTVSSPTRRYSLFIARTQCDAFDEKELEIIQEGMLLAKMALKLLTSVQGNGNHQRNLQDEKLASLGKLAAGVAHEINNPLGFVMSNFSTLSAYLTQIKAHPLILQMKDSELGEMLDDSESIIVESLEGLSRIKNIVASLNVYYHVPGLSVGMVDLRDVVSSAINMVLSEMKLKDRLNYETPKIPFYVLGQTHKLQQVLINLLVNALQSFPSPEGEVDVVLMIEDSRLIKNKPNICLSVCDSGKGISAEDLMCVFDPFFTTKRVGDGAGLGLSVAKEIIEEHLGKIDIQSTVGKGTCVYLRFPLYVTSHHSMKELG